MTVYTLLKCCNKHAIPIIANNCKFQHEPLVLIYIYFEGHWVIIKWLRLSRGKNEYYDYQLVC